MTQSFVEQLFGLSGQVAVVIGGTGYWAVHWPKGLAKAGAKVVVAGRDPEKGAERVEAIKRAAAGPVSPRSTSPGRDSIVALLDHVLTTDGRVDMLINGAGVNSDSSYLDAKDEDWDRVIQSNLKAVQLGLPDLRRTNGHGGGGSILNIASVTAHLPSRVFAYSAAKAAVVNLTQNVARELAPSGVRVNALSPGFFPAEQNRKILDATRTETIMEADTDGPVRRTA